MDKKTEISTLVNLPVSVTIGGAGSDEARDVQIKEPSMGSFNRQMKLIASGLYELIKNNSQLVGSAMEGKDVGGLNFNMGGFEESFKALVCDIVGETDEWIDSNMTPRQVVKVLSVYLDQVGYEQIVAVFSQALQQMQAVKIKRDEVPEPPKPPFVEQS